MGLLESGAGGPASEPTFPWPIHLGGQSLTHVSPQVQLLLQLCGEQHVRSAGVLVGLRGVCPPQVGAAPLPLVTLHCLRLLLLNPDLCFRALLIHGMERANLRPQGGSDSLPPGFSLTLVGFSKGCVVLNQMVYELAEARLDPLVSAFIHCITEMYWLDGGHPGGSETWVTDKQALKELAASEVSVHAHVTPYEVCDPMRAWVGREYRLFIQTLEEFGASLSKKLHFKDEPPSINNHFRVIQEF